jgi:hypothetical protein
MKARLVFWPIVLLAVVTVIFFLGGVYLDWNAAEHGLKGLLRTLKAENLSPDKITEVIAFQNDRVKSIHSAAAAAYDIAKVSLGALVSSVAQLLSRGTGHTGNFAPDNARS